MSSLGGERLASTRAGNQSAPCATHFVNPFERLRLLRVLLSLWIVLEDVRKAVESSDSPTRAGGRLGVEVRIVSKAESL